MRFLGRILAVALILLGGCTRVHVPREDERFGRYRFNYMIEADAKCGVIQVFDDGRQTFVQFADPATLIGKKISAENITSKRELVVKVSNSFLFVNEIAASLQLRFRAGKRSAICRSINIFLLQQS